MRRSDKAPEPLLLMQAWDTDDEFLWMQEMDPTLASARNNIAIDDGQMLDARCAVHLPRFKKVREALWWVAAPECGGGVTHWQLLVPEPYRARVLQQAHGHLWSGQQGQIRTLSQFLGSFFWPFISQDVQWFCKTCNQCQTNTQRGHPKAPLQPLPLVEQPFERRAMDFTGPLPRTAWGHWVLLTIIDYITRYPEAIPLRGMQIHRVARALLQLFAWVGIPKEILTDNGASFMSNLMRQLC